MIIHGLDGCAPTPLAHYLKAVGILRLVSEQADANARCWWQGESFRFASHLSEDDLMRFFLEQYSPTPFVAPWNGGTGFYPKDRKAAKALRMITETTSPRFAAYRAAIVDATAVVGTRKAAPEKKDKEDFLSTCKLAWR